MIFLFAKLILQLTLPTAVYVPGTAPPPSLHPHSAHRPTPASKRDPDLEAKPKNGKHSWPETKPRPSHLKPRPRCRPASPPRLRPSPQAPPFPPGRSARRDVCTPDSGPASLAVRSHARPSAQASGLRFRCVLTLLLLPLGNCSARGPPDRRRGRLSGAPAAELASPDCSPLL